MKYKIGNKVLIKSLDWYNKNKNTDGFVHCGDRVFDDYMSVFCGSVVTIGGMCSRGYSVREDMHCRTWTDEMIEGLVEEESKFGTASNPIEIKSNINCFTQDRVGELATKIDKELPSGNQNVWELPDGYIFKDENDNIINATKIILEKKKKEYPKNYEECCKVLGVDSDNYLSIRNLYCDDGEENTTNYEQDLLGIFESLWELKICRDAYWKLYGEEIGLGKPWEPDWNDLNRKYFISLTCDGINLYDDFRNPQILVFPTIEMRDAFFENFKKLINECKELL